MTKIKVCGITSVSDALAAVEAGADYLGFMFAPSPRQVDPGAACLILKSVPGSVGSVGVFVDALSETVRNACECCRLDIAQLHGSETPEYVRELRPYRAWKVIRVRTGEELEAIRAYTDGVDAILLDTYSPQMAGGTGKPFDWRRVGTLSRFGLPVVLAGGLNPDNVAEAVGQLHPEMVDVSSGVESSPGRKDHAKLKDFVQAVREADSQAAAVREGFGEPCSVA